ncbi:enoyl-CoA hydratase [Hephaestia caeni]|uniref:Enoyl-CoA hydratase n=1 Tax=Hephaestia caeni TaxID=645617 RepID=A0A397NX44_9SPHN|nr:enoyl-CoA hydratase-related protein [Hephaestia caeni]RIA37971.1 enoyl-CoA hydratase [Hephaestia caeni]
MASLVRTEQRGAVAIVSLDDPQNLNALSIPMLDELSSCLADAAATARAIVLRGEGRAFCAGFNIGPDLDVQAPGFDAGAVLETHLNPLMLQLRALPVPIVAAVRGTAAGAGASLALAADLVVAGAQSAFLQAFRHVGLVPDAGASWLLARTVGRVRAMELTLLGGRLDAPTALEWGLVNRVVVDEAVDSCALELAERLAEGPSAALARTREAIWTALEAPLAEQLDTERRFQGEAGGLADFHEGVAAFREKRKPRFA